MRYLSVCSGIEAASCAWHQLGWEAVAFSEIEPFPCRVLQHRFPDVPNLGDMTKIKGEEYRGAVDLLVGGTPCQDFSVAGKRAGMDGARSGLARDFARLLREIRPRWFIWENVPGAFSTNGGRDFWTFIGTLADIGYCLAWRVLDAQFFGVPQRRRRIFLVGHLGVWRSSGAVLFEPHSLCGNTEASRKKRPATTQAITGCLGAGGADDNRAQAGFYVPDIVDQAMSCKWSKGTSGPAGDEHHNLVCAVRTSQQSADGWGVSEDVAHTMDCANGQAICAPVTTRGYADNAAQESKLVLSFAQNQTGEVRRSDKMGTLNTNSNPSGRNTPMIYGMGVRRLTPLECEKLQGFPDGWTDIPGASDTARYKALGNSMAVPVMRWIGERIERVDSQLGG